ncbi:hypothetical protein GCM10027615_27000 [Plantactinospora veratri]
MPNEAVGVAAAGVAAAWATTVAGAAATAATSPASSSNLRVRLTIPPALDGGRPDRHTSSHQLLSNYKEN